MPASQKVNKHKQEQHAFGFMILRTGRAEVRRLHYEAAQPSLPAQKVWRSSFLLMDDLCARFEKTCNAEVLYWETTTPISTSGRILRVAGGV